MKTRAHWLLLVFALCCVSAQAGTITYSDSGTFTALTPSTAFSGPSETWAFAFQANTHPTVLGSNGGDSNSRFLISAIS